MTMAQKRDGTKRSTIGTLAQSVREYKKDSMRAPIYVTLESAIEILIPTLMAYLIDAGIYKGNMSVVVGMGLLMVLSAMVSLATGYLAGRSAAVASAGFAKNLRHDMFHSVQGFSFSNIDHFSTASIVTRLTTDVSNLQNAYQMLVRMAFRAPAMVVFALIMSFRIDAKLSWVFLASVPVLGGGLCLIITRVHPIFVRVFKTYDKLNNVIQENLLGIRVVKSFTREEHEKSKFMGISQRIFEDFSTAEKRLAFNAPLMQLCLYVAMLILSWVGAQDVIASGNDAINGLSTGELTGLIMYAMQILMSLMMLSMVFVMTIISRASAERIAELLNEKSDLHNVEHPVHEVKDGSIAFEDVTFTYARKADKPVLDHINLSIAPGQTVGILGDTGSSKSSLVQLIPRLYDAVEGRVLVGGLDVREYDLTSLRDQVAMVLQKNVLFSGTIKDNLRWGNEQATDEEMAEACHLAQADGFIREFPDGYDTYIERGGTNVSGGQRQRLCIARALLKKPKILILDDSTSAVDTKTEESIRRAFIEKIPDVTKIIIAQRALSVMGADQIVVMNDGKVDAVGKHDELLQTCAIYREVYESQTKGGGTHE